MSSVESRARRVILAQAIVAVLMVVSAVPAAAQAPERAAVTLVDAIHAVAADLREGALPVAVEPAPAVVPQPTLELPPPPQVPPSFVAAPRERPSLLLPLYGTFGLLQAMDAHSTLEAVRGGAVERNPLLAPIGHNAGALIAVKAATTAGTIVLAEKLWRRHPVRAVAVMVAVNVAYGAIVAANYRR